MTEEQFRQKLQLAGYTDVKIEHDRTYLKATALKDGRRESIAETPPTAKMSAWSSTMSTETLRRILKYVARAAASHRDMSEQRTDHRMIGTTTTKKAIALMIVSAIALPSSAMNAAAQDALTLEKMITLGSVTGRIDHLAVDIRHRGLFVAELGNNAIGIVDLAQGKLIKQLPGFREPQGVGYVPDADRLYVANAGDGSVDILSGTDWTRVAKVDLHDDADNIRVDASGNVYIGYGSGAIAVLEGATGKRIKDISLAAHPESFRLDLSGGRIFVNEPDAQRIGVIDQKSGKELARWVAPRSRANFPMDIDDAGHRLFVVYRDRPSLAVFDTGTGQLTAQIPACDDADDVFFDARRNRLYVSCGDGSLQVANAANGTLKEIARLPTRTGSRTSLFVPELDRLFVAIRSRGLEDAAIWVYRPQN